MYLKYCLKNEAFKALRGYEDLTEITNLFDSKEIGLISARNQEAAFQLLMYSDTGYTLLVDDNTSFNQKGITEALRVSAFLEAADQSFDISMNIEEFIPDDDGILKADILSEHP
jgi:mannose-6-phosphate isomerase class I